MNDHIIRENEEELYAVFPLEFLLHIYNIFIQQSQKLQESRGDDKIHNDEPLVELYLFIIHGLIWTECY